MRRAALLALLAFGLLACAHLAASLPSQSAVLKRKRGKKRASAEQRQLAERDWVAASVQRYLSNQELGEWLAGFEKRCKSVAKLSTIGASAEGRPIWALEISDRPGQAEAEPAVKYVGNVHGDEPTGRVLTLALAEWLCANHRTDPRAKRIVQSMHLWLVPTMNPDGFERKIRGNSQDKDLNRDFPDRFSSPTMQPSGEEQPEVAAMMAWSQAVGFVASASMHEGALVANYPWDGTADKSTRYEKCPDDSTFRHLASLYATTHRRMAKPDNPEFPNGGTTNGAAWYPIYGSMQDWNYIVGRCFELTLELSQSKWPEEAGLAALWEDNKDSLLAFPLVAAYGGLWGTVREEGSLRGSKGREVAPLGGANITVLAAATGEEQPAWVLSRAGLGDYYRPLAPGRYTVVVSKEGYKPFAANFTVPADGSGAQRHFVLAREDSSWSGEVAHAPRFLVGAAAEGTPTADGSAGGALPWKARLGLGGGGDAGQLWAVEETRGRDRLLMLGAGAACAYGLWITHSRLKRRSHPRRA
ncbi:hypothetical protein COHA_009329 [Chlorella ohadii]|uniref:Peptidase M14 domain-containing protein n=1 Tax=Chlorella ohadii TaxID=2649997 RepID=A0AAD5DI64_9CHLO|nr:hypothetical protein COHA_009329 [Chlorella ohadii]